MENIEKTSRSAEKPKIAKRAQMLLAALATLHMVSGEPAKAQSIDLENPTEAGESVVGETEEDRNLREDIASGEAGDKVLREFAEHTKRMRAEQDRIMRQAQENMKAAAQSSGKTGPTGVMGSFDAMGKHVSLFGEANEIMGRILSGEVGPNDDSLERLKKIGEEIERTAPETSESK